MRVVAVVQAQPELAFAIASERAPAALAPDTFIIYGLYAADAPDVIRYVGRAAASRYESRVREHLAEAKRGRVTHKCCWIRAVLTAGIAVEARILTTARSHDEANDLERLYVKRLGTQRRLTNGTGGGDGTPGRRLTEKQKRAVGESTKRRWTGRKHTPESIAKMSRAHRGVPQSPEVVAKRAGALRGRPLTNEHRRKVGDALRGLKRSQESRMRISEAMRNSPRAVASSRVNIALALRASIAVNTGRRNSPEAISKMRAKRLAFWSAPNHEAARAALAKARRTRAAEMTPEQRSSISKRGAARIPPEQRSANARRASLARWRH